MDTVTEFISNYTLSDLIAVIIFVVVCVKGFEGVGKWAFGKFNAYHKRRKGIEEKEDTLAAHTKELQALTERIDKFAATVEQHYTQIHEKVDNQQGYLERIEEEGKKRDCAVLRDRILGGMRYFSQNRDEEGNVHIALGDSENMEALYSEYFKAGGNGTIKKMYDNEFSKFMIDR